MKFGLGTLAVLLEEDWAQCKMAFFFSPSESSGMIWSALLHCELGKDVWKGQGYEGVFKRRLVFWNCDCEGNAISIQCQHSFFCLSATRACGEVCVGSLLLCRYISSTGQRSFAERG